MGDRLAGNRVHAHSLENSVLGEELWNQLQTEPAAAEVVGIPGREREILAHWYACTWVDVRDFELKAATRRGVVPGNPLADLLFNAVMVRILAEIHNANGESPGGVVVPYVAGENICDVDCVAGFDASTRVSDVTYIDDICLMVAAEKPEQLIERTAEMVRVCRRALAKYGLKMNFSQGKTECILHPYGEGSQALMASLQRVDEQRVIPVDAVLVRVVRSYRHLGTIHAATGNLTEETRAKVRVMISAHRELAGRVFGSPSCGPFCSLLRERGALARRRC